MSNLPSVGGKGPVEQSAGPFSLWINTLNALELKMSEIDKNTIGSLFRVVSDAESLDVFSEIKHHPSLMLRYSLISGNRYRDLEDDMISDFTVKSLYRYITVIVDDKEEAREIVAKTFEKNDTRFIITFLLDADVKDYINLDKVKKILLQRGSGADLAQFATFVMKSRWEKAENLMIERIEQDARYSFDLALAYQYLLDYAIEYRGERWPELIDKLKDAHPDLIENIRHAVAEYVSTERIKGNISDQDIFAIYNYRKVNKDAN
jgi:hypothetical protein